MSIPDPILNCVLAVCCEPGAAERALAKVLVDEDVCDKGHTQKCAAWLFEYFDLAPAGSLTALKTEIARLARDNP